MRKGFTILLMCSLIMPVLGQNALRFGVEIEAWNTDAGIELSDSSRDPNGAVGIYSGSEWLPSGGLIVQWGAAFFKATYSLETDFSGQASTATLLTPVPNVLGGQDQSTAFASFDTELKRRDADFSLGYSWANGIAVFGGYKTIDFSESFSTDMVRFVTQSFSPAGTLVNTVETNAAVNWLTANSFDYKGPFLGASYSYQFLQAPLSVSASLAYARLDVEQKGTANVIFQGMQLPFTPTRLSYDATGISWKVGMNYRISDHFSVGASYKAQRYNEDSSSIIAVDMDSKGFLLNARYMF